MKISALLLRILSFTLFFQLMLTPLFGQCDDWRLFSLDQFQGQGERVIWDGSAYLILVQLEFQSDWVLLRSPTGAAPWSNYYLSDEKINDLDWNGAFYSAVGNNGTLLTSVNLTDWQEVPTGMTDDFISIASGPGYFNLATTNGIYHSVNGFDWELVHPISQMNRIRWVGGYMVGVTADGVVTHSANGLDWTSVSVTDYYLRNVVWNGELFMAFGDGGGTVVTSNDLLSWSIQAFEYDFPVLAAAWTGTHFLLSTGTSFTYSSDFQTWGQSETDAPSGTFFRDMATNGDSVLVAGDKSRIYGSNDLVNFERASPYVRITTPYRSVTVGSATVIQQNIMNGSGTYLYSEDGLTWSQLEYETDEFGFQVTALDGNENGFLAGSRFANVGLSNDGVTWDVEALPGDNVTVNHVAASDQLFLAVNASNQIYSRPSNGGNWIPRGVVSEFGNINYLTSDGEGFMAVGEDGLIMTSADGAGWVTQTTPGTADLSAVVYGQALFGSGYVAVSEDRAIYFSTDGENWESAGTGDGGLYSVTATGSQFLAAGDGFIMGSYDGRNWYRIMGNKALGDFQMVGWNGVRTFAMGEQNMGIVTSSVYSPNRPPVEAAQATFSLGLEQPVLSAKVQPGVSNLQLTWSLAEDNTVLAVNEVDFRISPSPQETTRYRLTVEELDSGETHVSDVLLLVPVNPLYLDPNGDGANTIHDLYHVMQQWDQGGTVWDADGSGRMDIVDLLYVNYNGGSL